MPHQIRCHRRLLACVAVLTLPLLLSSNGAVAQDSNKLKTSDWRTLPPEHLLPTTANAVSIVRLEQILKSPRAEKKNYADASQHLYEAGEAVIPPWVKSLAIAALFRPSQEGPAYRAMVSTIDKDAPVVPQEGQAQMLFGKVPLLATDRDAVFAGRAGGRVVGWSPASRRELGYWLNGAFGQGLSPILSELVKQTSAEVILGLELADLVSESSARDRFRADASFDGLVDDAVKLLLGAESVSLTVDVVTELNCEIVITAQDKATQYTDQDAQLIRQVFLAILYDTGYHLPEFESFEVKADGSRIVLSGELVDDSLGALTSLALPPLPKGKAVIGGVPTPPTPGGSRPNSATRRPVRHSPLDDFQRATTMIDSLERRQKRATDPASVASWCDTTAGHLDDLSVTTGSSAVGGFASRSATRLRAMGSSLRGLATGLRAEENTFTYNVRRTPGWASVNVWGGVGYRDPTVEVETNLREVRERQARIVQESAGERESIWAMIQEDRASTERALLGVPDPE